MSPPKFTFINATGTPRLTKKAAKEVRGHVTKVKFAARRRQKGVREYLEDEIEQGLQTLQSQASAMLQRNPWSDVELVQTMSLAITRTDSHQAGALLNAFWYPIFLSKDSSTIDRTGPVWLELFVSDPAFIEVTIAAAMRYWLSSDDCAVKGRQHYSRAVEMVIRNTESRKTQSDGFLATILTLALIERFQPDESAWEMHIGGAVQVMKQRVLGGLNALPPMLTDLMIMDVVNTVYGFPRVFHESIRHELENQRLGCMSTISVLVTHFLRLREIVNQHRDEWAGPADVPRNVEELWMKCYMRVKFLEVNQNSYVRATAVGLKLVLFLFVTVKVHSALWTLADELKAALSDLPGRTCCYMDLTSCPIILGAIAAEKGSKTRSWFIGKLRASLDMMRSRGWRNLFHVLERTVKIDANILERLRAIRSEIEEHNVV